jgi:magnesium transporter
VARQSRRTLALQFLADHPEEAASILEGRPPSQVAALLEEASVELAGGILRRMTPSAAADCLQGLAPSKVARIAETLPAGAVAALLRRVEAAFSDSVLSSMEAPTANAFRSMLRHPEDSAGALMDPRVLAFPGDIRVKDAIARLRKTAQASTYYLYIVDRDQKLVGVLNVRELLVAQPERMLTEVMHQPVARLDTPANRRTILHHPGWRVHHALPVVDGEERFLGVIRYETVRDLEQESARKETAPPVLDTAMRLGELMWVALGGLFAGFAGPPTNHVDSGKVTGRNRGAE